jgi:Tol biopolymer transport system component
MDNDVTSSPLSALMATYRADDFLLVGGVITIVLSSIFVLSSSLLDQSAFGTFPGENGKIAFSSARDDNCYEIYSMNGDGSDITRLTNNSEDYDRDPNWSPDGTKIAFAASFSNAEGQDLKGEIYVMNEMELILRG